MATVKSGKQRDEQSFQRRDQETKTAINLQDTLGNKMMNKLEPLIHEDILIENKKDEQYENERKGKKSKKKANPSECECQLNGVVCTCI